VPDSLLPPVIAVLTANVAGFEAGMTKARASMEETAGAGDAQMSGLAKTGGAALAGIAAGAVAISVVSLKMAGDFQESMTRLVVGAGESQGAIGGLSQQVLALSGKVAQAPKDLAAALYPIESVGYHGAQGISVLKAAAEGATASGANLGTVANALAGAMHAFSLQSSDATSTMNTLQAAVASGKMTLDDITGALGTVGPVAATAHISLQEVTAAIATMTSSGTPAAQAATYLKQTIAQLENPTTKAVNTMGDLGLSAIQVSQTLGTKGLAATMQLLTDAIEKKMGPAGLVYIDQLQKQTKAGMDANNVISGFPAGARTYIGELANMVGGTKSMQAALELTGPHMAEFQKNIGYVSAQAKSGAGSVAGFKLAMEDFNTKIRAGEDVVKALLIQLGLKLIPVVEAAVSAIAGLVTWLSKHKEIAIGLAVVVGGVLAAAIWAYLAAVVPAIAATALWFLTFNIGTGGILLAIGALVAGIVYVAGHWKQVMHDLAQWFEDAVGFVKKHVVLLLAIFAPFLLPIYEIATHWHEIWSDIQKWTGEAIDAVISFVASLPEKMAYWAGYAIGAYIRFWIDLPGNIWSILMDVLHFLEDFVPRAIEWTIHAGKEVIEAIIGFWAALPGRLGGFLEDSWHTLTNIVPRMAGAAVDLGSKILNGIVSFIANIPGELGNLAMAIVHLIEGAASDALNAAAHLGSAIWAGFKKGLGISSPSYLERAMDDIMGSLQGKMGPLGDIVGGVNGLIPGVGGSTISPVLGAIPALGAAGAGGADVGDVPIVINVDGQALMNFVLKGALLRNRRNQSATVNVGWG
jgi:TP901 family phage tail tape measure protein